MLLFALIWTFKNMFLAFFSCKTPFPSKTPEANQLAFSRAFCRVPTCILTFGTPPLPLHGPKTLPLGLTFSILHLGIPGSDCTQQQKKKRIFMPLFLLSCAHENKQGVRALFYFRDFSSLEWFCASMRNNHENKQGVWGHFFIFVILLLWSCFMRTRETHH